MITHKISDPQQMTRVYSPEPALKHPVALVQDLMVDLNRGRELAWRLFVRDVSAQYRQTALGYVWAFLPPLAASATFIFLQSQGIVKIEGTGLPYAAFAMMGTLLWQTFVEAMQSPINAVAQAKPMLAKINFPREAILMAGLYMVGFNFLIRLALLVVIMLIWQVVPGITLLLFPLMVLGLILCGFCIGMLFTPIGGLYGDVGKGIPILAQFWMLLTPVVYPARETGLAGMLATWNPVAPVLATARATLTGQPLDFLWPALFVIAAAGVAAFVGLTMFRLVMPHMISRMGG